MVSCPGRECQSHTTKFTQKNPELLIFLYTVLQRIKKVPGLNLNPLKDGIKKNEELGIFLGELSSVRLAFSTRAGHHLTCMQRRDGQWTLRNVRK
jgi:hypothetical protein